MGMATVFKNPNGSVQCYNNYDPFGRRVWTQFVGGPSIFFIYDGDMLLGEVPSLGGGVTSVSAAYTWGAAGLISERLNPGTANARSLWYHYGPQGETRQLTNSAGAVVDTYNYTAYGVPISATGSDPNPFRYGGQVGYYTYSNGLVLCGARWYNPDMGRWIRRDPAGYSGGANLFEYCGSDPVNCIDPSGFERNGSIFQYIFSRDYINDGWTFFQGEMSNFNPRKLANGLYDAGRHINDHGWSGVKDVGSSFWSGLQFWNQPDLESMGASFMGDVLLAAPLTKRIPSLKIGSAAAATCETSVTVSRWGRPGLLPGDWVMKGPATRWNYIRTAKWQKGFGNEFAGFGTGEEFTVPASSIRRPNGKGLDGKWKGWFGQRKYHP